MKIEETRKWYSSDVRTMCIRNEFYTCGDNEAYGKMLSFVNENEPTNENIYKVASDIQKHSEGQTTSNIMFCLMQDAVYTFFTVDGQEEF